MYSVIAADCVLPFKSDHAWYFAFATKSNGLAGGSILTSPSVACLYNEYNSRSVPWLGRSDKDLLSETAWSNCCLNSMVACV